MPKDNNMLDDQMVTLFYNDPPPSLQMTLVPAWLYFLTKRFIFLFAIENSILLVVLYIIKQNILYPTEFKAFLDQGRANWKQS